MSSTALTRTVMHRIIANQPIHHHDVAQSVRRHGPQLLLQARRCRGPRTHIRSIFAAFSRGSSSNKVYNLSRSEMTLQRHAKALHEAYMLLLVNTRTTSKTELETTFNAYFKEMKDSQELVTDHQAGILLKVFNFLSSSDQGDPTMTVSTAKAALQALAEYDHGRTDTGMLHDNPPFEDQYWVFVKQLADFVRKNDSEVDNSELLVLEAQCLAKTGHAELIKEQMQNIKDRNTWKLFIKGQMSDPTSTMSTLRLFQEHGPEADDELTSLFVQSFICAGQSDLARRMLHGSGLLKAPGASLKPAADILEACVHYDDSPTAVEIMAKVDQEIGVPTSTSAKRPGLPHWTVQLARYQSKGQNVSEVPSIVQKVFSQHDQALTIDDLNMFINDAYQADHPAFAKTIIEFAPKLGLQHNGYTFLPQALYKLRRGDLEGALATWDYILYDLEALRPEDMAAPMEELLRSIVSAPDLMQDQFEEIMDNHPKYARRFRPETVAALVNFYLRNDEFENAALLMRKHAPGFTSAARLFLLEQVMTICRDTNVSDECVWNVYNMIKALFDEAPRSLREQVLQVTLQRNMKDKALEIFRNLRDHWLAAMQPGEETYLLALSGLEDQWYATQTVHNSLKLDIRVDPSTKLFNALMRAYARCGQNEARAAVDFWDHVRELRPGANEDSAVYALEACTVSPVGTQQAEQIWNVLGKGDIAISERILGAYLNNLVLAPSEETNKVLDQEVQQHNLDRGQVLQSTFASAIGRSQKLQIADWLAEEHPAFWASPQASTFRKEAREIREKFMNVDDEYE